MPLIWKAFWMHNTHRKNLVVKWYRRSQGEDAGEFDIFDKFTSLWVSFNSWLTFVTQEESDRAKIERAKVRPDLVSSYNGLLKNDKDFNANVLSLQGMCPIYRNKGYQGSREVRISNVGDFSEVLEAIYAIRCNFFHGEKSPEDKRDIDLTTLAFRILSKVFGAIVQKIDVNSW